MSPSPAAIMQIRGFPQALRRLMVAAGSEGNVDREHSGAPVGETGSHAAVGTDQRGQTGEVLIGSRAGLAGQGNPHAEAAGVPTRVAQAAAFPPGETLPPGPLARAPPVHAPS